jgi:hypothetical protein
LMFGILTLILQLLLLNTNVNVIISNNFIREDNSFSIGG